MCAVSFAFHTRTT